MNHNCTQCMELYISTQGRDSWSGKLSKPNLEGTDGPFATIQAARDMIRKLRASGRLSNTVKVMLRGGSYAIKEPILFNEDDSWPVTYSSYPGEKAVIDGGEKIVGWKTSKKEGITLWSADLPDVAAGKWYFRELFVNGERRSRTRFPKKGFYQMNKVENVTEADNVWLNLFKGSYAFQYKDGDIFNWRNMQDVDIIVDHFWVDERIPVDSIDESSNMLRSKKRSIFILKDDVTFEYSKYFVENVYEALSEPGEWYLDRTEGKIYYIPMPGECIDTAEIIAPCINQFIKVCGRPEENKFVEFLSFQDLVFCNSDWCQPTVTKGYDILPLQEALDKSDCVCTTPQSAIHVPGTIYFEGARYCSIDSCRIEHIGWYGIELADGCTGISIKGNEIFDMGAGGIKMGGSNSNGLLSNRTGNNMIIDNHIKDGGRVFRNGTGIFSIHSYGNEISHNHIHDFYYIGISCGWVWGYSESVSKNNRIEKNYIHDLGHGVMSDIGAIYTLGVQPGTVIRGNVIHDIEKRNYGGRGIYLDEGSAHIIVENNICTRVSSHPFLVHYGRENIIRNNIFGLGGEGQVDLIRGEDHISFTFERNIVITDGKPLMVGEGAAPVLEHKYISERNLFWDVSGRELLCGNGECATDTNWYFNKSYTFEEWQDMGYDINSINADPLFKDILKSDFSLSKDSPAFSIGFKPIDVSDVGPRGKK